MKQARGTAYYLGLVAKRNPAIYEEYLAGSFKSANAAILAAGVRKPIEAGSALSKAWKAANADERADFLIGIGAVIAAQGTAVAPSSIATSDRKLTEHAKRRFKALFPMSPFPCGYIMGAIDRPTTDVSLWHAITHGYKLKPGLIAKLNVWLPAEEAWRKALVES